jgi:hypothetical protein
MYTGLSTTGFASVLAALEGHTVMHRETLPTLRRLTAGTALRPAIRSEPRPARNESRDPEAERLLATLRSIRLAEPSASPRPPVRATSYQPSASPRSSAIDEVLGYCQAIAAAGTSGIAPGTKPLPDPHRVVSSMDRANAARRLERVDPRPDMRDPLVSAAYRAGLAAGTHAGWDPFRACRDAQIGVVLGVPRRMQDAVQREAPGILGACHSSPSYIVIFDGDAPAAQVHGVLAHELGHAILHGGDWTTTLEDGERQAEAFSWGFCWDGWSPKLA